MKNRNLHDTLFTVHGGLKRDKDPSNILLRKRTSSVVYCPKSDERQPGSMYPRAICLEHNGEKNQTLLATFECYTFDTPVFPIYESTDNAVSWHLKSKVEDKEKGFGCRYQPQLFELPCDCGELKEGTILCAGNIIPDDFSSTCLHLYKSTDAGETWKFMSEIVSGGVAAVDGDLPDEKRPVWEPFLAVTPDGKLICYYSDEGYAQSMKYNQLLAHKVSEDGGYTWSEAKIDVAYPDGFLRPGMPIVAALPNGTFIMVYEMYNQDGVSIYFRISEDMEDWGDVDFMGNPVVTAEGEFLSGTPYVIWIPQGGENGTILVSGHGFSHILANSNLGEGFWEKMDCLIDIDFNCGFAGYSQCMIPLNGGKQLLNLCPRQISDKLGLIEAAVADVYVRA